MNFQLAAIVGGAAFVLSLLAGLIGGVPFFDIVLRALLWGAFGVGACLGIEAVLKSMLPDLFVPAEGSAPEPEAEDEDSRPATRVVDIVVEDDGTEPARFVEEQEAPRAPAASAAPAEETPAPGPADEEMPEIGSFLDAFKPGGPEASEEAAPASPEFGEYAPGQGDSSLAKASEVTIDGEAQDPAILAKAVQTVMKRDGQGT